MVDRTYKDDAGFSTSFSNNELDFSFILDFLYILIVILFITQIIGGLIIDTFAALREKYARIEEDKNKVCFICGQDR